MYLKLCQRSGFTLLEIVISVLLFAITAAGVAGALSGGLASLRDARDMLVAQTAIQQELAFLRSMERLPVQSEGPFLSEQDLLYVLGGRGELTIEPMTGFDQLFQVTAVVVWLDQSRQESRLQLSTILSGEDMQR